MLRRNRYHGPELHDERPAGRYWFTGGWNLAGFAALLLGMRLLYPGQHAA